MTIISGHQRLKACKDLLYKTVPVIINDSLEDDDEKLKTLIAANFGRLKNDPIKQAKLLIEYEKLSGVRQGSAGKRKIDKDNLGLNQEKFAKEFGISTQQLRDIKRLTTILPDIQDIISEGRILDYEIYLLILFPKMGEQEYIWARQNMSSLSNELPQI